MLYALALLLFFTFFIRANNRATNPPTPTPNHLRFVALNPALHHNFLNSTFSLRCK